jgi:DNA primase
MRSRGLGEDIWEKAQIGVCLEGQQAGRIVVPVLAPDGLWVGWVARIWTKKGHLPYVYPRGMQRGSVLYNQAALLVKTEKPVLVVEGVFDSLAYWPDSVAVLGKPSGPQVDALVASKRPVAVVLDGDAHDEGTALAGILQIEGQRAGDVWLPPGKDPDEIDKDVLWEAAYRCLQEGTVRLPENVSGPR